MEVNLPVKTASAIAPLLRDFPAALYAIAPERHNALRDALREVRQIDVIEGSAWTCETVFGAIRVSTKVFELLWAMSYAYTVFYRVVSQGKPADGRVVVLGNYGELDVPRALLRWVASDLESGCVGVWPPGIPTPATAPEGIDRAVANELSLVAAGWILHHELAHIRLRGAEFASG